MSKAIVDLAVMYVNGTLPTQFQSGDVTPNDALRAGFNEILGLEPDCKVLNQKAFRAHKMEIFALLEEVLEKTIHEGSLGVLENWVEYRNLKLGDTNLFKAPDNQLFKVAVISDGNGNLRRQRLREGEEFSVRTEILGVKIYEEFSRFYSGRIDFLDMIDKVGQSFVKDIKERIFNTLLATFRAGGSDEPYRVTVTAVDGVPQEDKVLELAKHLEAKTGFKPVVVGSALALYKANPKFLNETDKEIASKQAYAPRFAGLEVLEIPPMHKEGTDEFALGDDELFLIPQTAEGMIKVVNEGEAIIVDNTESVRDDLQLEYLMIQKVGISVVPSSTYGYIKFT